MSGTIPPQGSSEPEPASAEALTVPEGEDSKAGRPLLIALIAVVGVLLLVAVILLTILLSGGRTPEEPEPEPEPEPAAPATIVDFAAEATTVECADTSSGTTATVRLSWTVADAERIALARGSGELDAIEEASQDGLPAEQTGYTELPYTCDAPVLVYSLTAANADDERSNAFITIERTVVPPPPSRPSISSAGWTDGVDNVICPSLDNGLSVTKGISWTSTPGVNSVSLYYATDGNTYPSSSASFTRIANGLPASGAYPLQIDCGTSGYATFFAVKIVVSNASGTTERLITGNTGT